MIVVLTHEQIREMIKNFFYIPTGSIKLDEILQGGIRSNALHELSGLSGSGKTQMCFELMFNAVTSTEGFLNNSTAVYIGSKKSFFPERIKHFVNRYNKDKGTELDPETVLKKIMFKQVNDFDELAFTVHYLHSLIVTCKNHKNIRLIVFDTFSAPFRELRGYERTPQIYELTSVLGGLAQDFNIPIVLSCDMTPIQYRTDDTNEKKIVMDTALGDHFAARMSQRIELEKIEDDVIIVKVWKNCAGRGGLTTVKIDQESGIIDVPNTLKRKSEEEYQREVAEKRRERAEQKKEMAEKNKAEKYLRLYKKLPAVMDHGF
ncbi:meiotic recombination protein DMC1/LIM15 homolog [Chironomus tepperi]|uniref:meiotic recombination protein DMC1/LIM15 homolog n=1 Tax=Chironomus tepperi TaxID=113505 RepID=UPI00391EE335